MHWSPPSQSLMKCRFKNNRYHDQTRIRRNLLLLKSIWVLFDEEPPLIEHEFESFCFQPQKQTTATFSIIAYWVKAADFGKSLDDPIILHRSNNKKDGMMKSTWSYLCVSWAGRVVNRNFQHFAHSCKYDFLCYKRARRVSVSSTRDKARNATATVEENHCVPSEEKQHKMPRSKMLLKGSKLRTQSENKIYIL